MGAKKKTKRKPAEKAEQFFQIEQLPEICVEYSRLNPDAVCMDHFKLSARDQDINQCFAIICDLKKRWKL